MLNRRAFVQSLGLGAVGTVTWLEVPLGAAVVTHQRAAVPLPAGAVRIGSNENPYGPLPSAFDAARAAALEGHRYPGALTSGLVEAIASKHGVSAQRVMLSGGSGDVLRAAMMTFTSAARALVTGAPSYEAPVRQAIRSKVPVSEVPLTPDLKLNLGAMLSKAGGSGLIYICNPNNPTSTVVPIADVTALIAAVAASAPETYVLVDEAYFEYVDDPAFGTAIPLVDKYPNLVVARTFSKIHGMAGMRVGYAIAQEMTLAAMRENLSASGLSSMSLAAAAASLADTAGLEKNRALNRDVRRLTIDAFRKAGYLVAASEANFVMVDVRRDSRAFQEACRQKGIAIGRPFPPLTTWARITIGTRQEMERAMPVFMDLLTTAPTASVFAPDAAADDMTC
jgi:histidinol-phosphate aminotransferase